MDHQFVSGAGLCRVCMRLVMRLVCFLGYHSAQVWAWAMAHGDSHSGSEVRIERESATSMLERNIPYSIRISYIDTKSKNGHGKARRTVQY